MKLITSALLCLVGALWMSEAAAQPANASLNIQTQNGGQVAVGSIVDILVVVSNTGPSSITGYRVRARISVPMALATILPTAQQTGLFTGWTVSANVAGSGSIDVCNGTDVIPAGTQRQILVKVQGTTIGGPQTVNGQLLFSNGTSCTLPGSLTGDNSADNTSTSSITVIPAPTCSLTGVTVAAGTITCNGGTTNLTATAATGSAVAIEYSLNNGTYQSSNVFTVGAGNYIVTAREVNTPACSGTASSVAVTEPPAVGAPIVGSITQPTCAIATGSVDLSGLPAGNWTINPGAMAGSGTTATINGLTPGNYNFAVTNSAGCSSAPAASVMINVQPTTPAAPIPGAITQPDCATSTGSVILNGLPAGNWIINPGAVTGNTTTATINSLNPGTYNFTVTNDQGCTSPSTGDVFINNVPGAPPPPTVNVIQPTCSVSTGTISVTSDTAGYTFNLDGGSYTNYPPAGYVVPAGAHTLTLRNAGNCISSVTNITVDAQPATPAAPTVSITQPTCTVANGTVTVTSTTTGLTFSFDGNPFAPYPTGAYDTSAGLHTLEAKSAAGCISAVTDITINAQPAAPTVSAVAGTIACNGGTTSLAATGAGGTGSLEYSLDGGAFQAGNSFTVGAGPHTIMVRDANLCSGSATVTINQPVAIAPTASSGAIACHGGTSTITVAVTGGVAPFLYSLNGGPFQANNSFTVNAGTYAITVKDANDCTATTNAVTVSQPSTLTAAATAKRIKECGGKAEVTVTATGGLPPYTSGVGTFAKGPGTWIFQVTDSGGCTDTVQVTIEPPGCMDPKISPNPVRSTMTIDHSVAAEGAMMQIFDMKGALVLSKAISPNTFQTTIDVRILPSGRYVLMFLNGNDKKGAMFDKIN